MSRRKAAVRAQAATPFDGLINADGDEQTNPETEEPETEQQPLTLHDEKPEPEPEPEPDLQDEKTIMALGEAWLIAHFGSKSNAIRELSALGHKCGPISRALNILYQHARNVLNRPLKRLIKEEREHAKLGMDVEELEGDEE
jgi:hypothetical protein